MAGTTVKQPCLDDQEEIEVSRTDREHTAAVTHELEALQSRTAGALSLTRARAGQAALVTGFTSSGIVFPVKSGRAGR